MTGRTARGSRESLVREMCDLIGELAAALEDESVPSVRMPWRQQALLWCFALLLDRAYVRGAASVAHDSHAAHENGVLEESRVADDPWRTVDALRGRPCLRQQLEDLARVEHQYGGVQAVTRRLRSLSQSPEWSAILWQFDPESLAPNPMVEIFEQLMACSDRALRRKHGAWYTPNPLVKFLCRSTHQLLQSDLGVAQGLVSESQKLCVVDPACGSGSFLLGLLAHVRSVLESQSLAGPPQVTRQVVLQWLASQRLTGIDVMPASCVAAELLVEQELMSLPAATDAAADAATDAASWSAQCASPLSGTDLSRDLFAGRVPVILGNPPYSNFGRQNRDAWIVNQLEEYKKGLNEKKLNLDDDFIKFVRWAQYWVEQAGQGIVGLVTNNTYLSGLTHRQMRASLAESFDRIYVLDLHGSSKKREVSPDGSKDENVFEIQQGVSIGLFVKTPANARPCEVWHADLWGSRHDKLTTLAGSDVTTVSWSKLDVCAPQDFFVPRCNHGTAEYESWPRLDEVFQDYVSGVQSKRDKLFVGFSRDAVAANMQTFLNAAAHDQFADDVPLWLRKKSVGVDYDARLIRPYMVAPLDVRWIYYEPRLLGRARYQVLRHLVGDSAGRDDNVALVFMRQTTNPPPYDHYLVTNVLASDRVFYSAHGAPFIAPLFLLANGGTARHAVANLNPGFVQQLASRLGIPFQPHTHTHGHESAMPGGFTARDVLHWVYATLHDRAYRDQYDELLRSGFPRLPWPTSRTQFSQLCASGSALVASHLTAIGPVPRAPDAIDPDRIGSDGIGSDSSLLGCQWPDSVELRAGFPRWQAGQLTLSSDFGWPEPVEEAVWEARMGGYPVLPRWFKQRRGRALWPSDLRHVAQMIEALRSSVSCDM